MSSITPKPQAPCGVVGSFLKAWPARHPAQCPRRPAPTLTHGAPPRSDLSNHLTSKTITKRACLLLLIFVLRLCRRRRLCIVHVLSSHLPSHLAPCPSSSSSTSQLFLQSHHTHTAHTLFLNATTDDTLVPPAPRLSCQLHHAHARHQRQPPQTRRSSRRPVRRPVGSCGRFRLSCRVSRVGGSVHGQHQQVSLLTPAAFLGPAPSSLSAPTPPNERNRTVSDAGDGKSEHYFSAGGESCLRVGDKGRA